MVYKQIIWHRVRTEISLCIQIITRPGISLREMLKRFGHGDIRFLKIECQPARANLSPERITQFDRYLHRLPPAGILSQQMATDNCHLDMAIGPEFIFSRHICAVQWRLRHISFSPFASILMQEA